VHFAKAASRLLVLARTGDARDAIDLFMVDPKASGVKLTQDFTLASDCQYKVEFSNCEVPAADRIGAEGSGWKTWDALMHDAIILCAAQAIGGAERALELTVEYAKERKQFDKPLGAFQALAHYMADAATTIAGGKVVIYEAAWARDQGRPITRLAPMAKLFACQTYRDVTATCQQIWGGVGFTVEYDIQLFFRRAKQLQLAWCDPPALEERIAGALLD
jgi:alkylation response protein AidB-like acyl-CoA dehydrogenase